MKTPLTTEDLQYFLQNDNSVNPRIHAKYGSISVQASQFHYCSPRNDYGPYTHVEIGLPSREIKCLLPYAEDVDRPCDTVYGWVPIEIAVQAINELENEEGE